MAQVQNERDVDLESAIQRIESQPPQQVTLVGRNNVLIAPNAAEKMSDSTVQPGWDGDAYSQQNSTDTAYATAVPTYGNKEIVFGLNGDPTRDTLPDSIDYGWHLHADGSLSLVIAGNEVSLDGTSSGGVSTGTTGGGTTPSTGLVVDYYGSSFVYGYDGTTGGGQVATPMPAYIDGHTNGATFNNKGVNSSTTTKALAGTNGVQPDWATLMSTTKADWVMIQYGLLDGYDISATQYQTNLTQMFNDAVASGKKVVFISDHMVSSTIGNTGPFASAMKSTAATLNTPYIDLYTFSTTLFANGAITDWLPDGYHPNQSTYNQLAQYITDQLLTFMNGLTSSGTGSTGSTAFPQSGTICCWGDSITLGMDANFNRVATPAPATMDADLANFTVFNEGVTDNTTTRTLQGKDMIHPALDTWLQNHPYTYFILQMTFNDNFIDGGVDVTTYKNNIISIVNTVRNHGVIVIFETCNETTSEAQLTPYRTAFVDVSNQMGIYVIDQFAYLYNYRIANNLQITDLYPNGFHPTQAIYDMKGHYMATRFNKIIGAA